MALTPAVGLPMFGITAAGQSYNQDVKEGVDKPMAAGRAAVSGVLEAGTEILPVRKMWNILGGKKFIKNFAEMVGTDLVGEEVNTSVIG